MHNNINGFHNNARTIFFIVNTNIIPQTICFAYKYNYLIFEVYIYTFMNLLNAREPKIRHIYTFDYFVKLQLKMF